MSDEQVGIASGDEIEIIEDYIMEELDESLYTVNIKEEYLQKNQNAKYLSVHEENSQIVSLGKEKNSGDDIYHCAVCNKPFLSIQSHLKQYHHKIKEKKWICSKTENPVLNQSVIIGIKSGCGNTTKCENCTQGIEAQSEGCFHQYVFQGKRELESCKNQAVQIFSCEDCPQVFRTLMQYRKHQNLHKLPKTARNDCDDIAKDKMHCNICNTTFTSAKNLKLHAKMHFIAPIKSIKDALPFRAQDSKSKNMFYCETCKKSFDYTLLQVHQNMHQNAGGYNCSICNRQFENEVSYDMHIQLHADQPVRPRLQQGTKSGARFPCNYCGREFSKPHEKVKHERIHTGEKPHECEVCGKSFRVSYSLTLHLRTHTDARPFVCAQCNKRFKSYAVYSHHLNTHSDSRPYQCPMCSKSFRTSVQLCGHKNSHLKPYNCPECNRPFASLYAVKMHMKTHNKANKSNDNLKHRCGICGAVYARLFALRIHVKEQHTGEGNEKILDNTCHQTVEDEGFLNEDEVSTHAIIEAEEIVVQNFHEGGAVGTM